MSRLIAATVAVAVALSCTAVATADEPPGQTGGGPPMLTPPMDTPSLNHANVLHCQSLDGGPGVVVVNMTHPDGLGSCDLGG